MTEKLTSTRKTNTTKQYIHAYEQQNQPAGEKTQTRIRNKHHVHTNKKTDIRKENPTTCETTCMHTRENLHTYETKNNLHTKQNAHAYENTSHANEIQNTHADEKQLTCRKNKKEQHTDEKSTHVDETKPHQ